ncbi:MAG: putative phosphoribosyl transferase [Chloroflexia bacterium]|jgi:predicted phosphoribosyltransferase|nr:putative phosphoribosyl transferase [Chloroflexia bacterium]
MTSPFDNRKDAGRQLAGALQHYAHRADVLVLALPRGGVPVAFEVAQALSVPLDVFLVRKLGVPGHEELAMGAIATGGLIVLNESVVKALQITRADLDRVAATEREELARREGEYRGDRPPPQVQGRTVILIDDGLATGSTMRAAAAALRQQEPDRIVIAVPVSSPQTCQELGAEVDEIVCLITPEMFYAVGMWYIDFSATTDVEVRDLLQQADNHALPHGTTLNAAN